MLIPASAAALAILDAERRTASVSPLWKQPVSVLVVIYTPDMQFLLLERKAQPGFWQSVTGSQETSESLGETAWREVREETGIDYRHHANRDMRLTDWHYSTVYDIFPQWRHRYAPGITRNTEHWFSLQVPRPCPVRLSPAEHRNSCWLPAQEAATRCFSDSNREAILKLAGGFHPDGK